MKLTKSSRIVHTLQFQVKDIIDLLPTLGTDYVPDDEYEIILVQSLSSRIVLNKDSTFKLTWTKEK